MYRLVFSKGQSGGVEADHAEAGGQTYPHSLVFHFHFVFLLDASASPKWNNVPPLQTMSVSCHEPVEDLCWIG